MEGKISKLSILSLIFSVSGCLLLVGVVLAIIDLCKKDGRKKILSIISLGICGFWFLISVVLAGASGNQTEISTTEAITTEATTEAVTTETITTEASTEMTEATSEAVSTEAITMGQRNALSKAYDYLSLYGFSYNGLIEQLEFEGFTNEEATYAVDHCGADWNEQAAKKAQQYLDYTSFSREGLIEQLEFEGFTPEQAEYGVTAVGY